MRISLSLLVIAALGFAAPAPAAETDPPTIVATILTPEPIRTHFPDRRPELIRRTLAALVTLHDLGRSRLLFSEQPAASFENCLALPNEWDRPGDGARNGCIGALLAPAAAGGVHVAIIVEDTLKRSSAQDATCIGPGGKVGRESVYLADLFHISEAVRFGVREAMMRCLDGAVGAAD